METVVNREFPHFCVIRRILRVSPFSDDKEEEGIYEGCCRREASANIRTFAKGTSVVGQQISVDYRVCIPGTVPIRKGDIADIYYQIGKDSSVMVTQTNTSDLKTERYPEGRTEFYYSNPQT